MTDARARTLYGKLGPLLPNGWRDATPWGYPQQVELALVAGVFRAQAPQATVDAVVDTFMRARPHDLLDDLTGISDAGAAGMADALGPRFGDTTVLGVPVLRATVIFEAAAALVALGIRTGEDLRAACLERPDAVRASVLAVRGIGKRTWEWIALLAHARVALDAPMVALVRDLLDETDIDAEHATEVLRLTARRFASDERSLSHAVREYLGELSA